MKNYTIKAQVSLKVDILLSGSWGSGCTMEQVEKQATEGALRKLRQVFKIAGESDIGIRNDPDITVMIINKK